MNQEFETELTTEIVDSCPLCNNFEANLLFWGYDRVYRLPGKFGTLECTQCKLIRLSPRPTNDSISQYYPENYGAYKTPSVSANSANSQHSLSVVRDAIRNAILWRMGYEVPSVNRLQKFFSPFLTQLFFSQATYGYKHLFPDYVPHGAALEVGCGNGRYLSYLKYHGWDVSGVDLSIHAAQAAKQNFDIDVFIGQLEEAPFNDATFDYIHLSHVVEHFFNPVVTMQKVSKLLKQNGIVYVEVPNAEGVGAKESKEFWYGWDAPRHLFMFTPHTLEKLIESSNLKILKMDTILWDSFDWTNTFIQEEETGEKLLVRPSVSSKDIFKINKQRVFSRIKHQLKPNNGDFIRCWAIKSGSNS